MPAAIPVALQIGAAALAGAAGVGAIVTSLLIAGAGILGSYIASQFFSEGAQQASDRNDLKANTSTTERTMPILYGTHRVGGNDVFIESSDNGYLWMVQCFCEGPIEGFGRIKLEHESPTGETHWDAIFIDGEDLIVYEKAYAHMPRLPYQGVGEKERKVLYYLHTGTNTQDVDPFLNTTFPSFKDPMRNTAYIYFGFKKGKIVNIPNREVIVHGRVIYDLRTGLTVFSRNPAIILYDYLTNTRYGVGWDSSVIEVNSWKSSANYCDGTSPEGRTPRYAIDYAIGRGLKSQTIIDTILSHFRGCLTWWDGKLRLTYLDTRLETVAGDITDAEIARADSGEDIVSVSQPSSHSVPDGVVIRYMTYLKDDHNWAMDDVHIGDSDGQAPTIDFPGYSDRAMAYDMGLYTLKRQQANKSVSLTLRPDFIQYDINDLVRLTSTELAISNELYRVVQNDISSEGLSNVSLLPESDYLYTSGYTAPTQAQFLPDAGSPFDVPPPVEDIIITEEIYDYRERSFVKLDVTFSPPTGYAYFSHVEVKVSTELEESSGTISTHSATYPTYYTVSDTLDWDALVPDSYIIKDGEYRGVTNKYTASGLLPNLIVLNEPFTSTITTEFEYIVSTKFNVMANSSGSFQIDPVAEGSIYYMVLRAVSTAGVRQDDGDSAIKDHEVIGIKDTLPIATVDLTESISENTLQLNCKKVSPVDIQGYEVRLGVWTNGVFLARVIDPPILFGGVKPGIHTIMVNTLGTNGLYGNVPAFTTLSVPDPPAFHQEIFSGTVNLASGQFDNMVLDSGYLKCQQTGGNLVGEYTSDAIFLSGKRDILDYTLTYVNFSSDVTGTPEDQAASDISITIRTCPSPVWYTNLLFSQAEFLMGAFSDSYVKIVVKITDSNLTSNVRVKDVVVKSSQRILTWANLIR